MSWSVTAFGKPAAVRSKLAGDFARIKCSEPEETIKTKVAEAIDAGLSVMPATDVVRVEASGSQYQPGNTPGELRNQLAVKIEPITGFLE